MKPGIYVHVPFCSAICPYCDFAVTVGRPGKHARFVDALVREIERAAAAPDPAFARPDTVYLGGGTPSILGTDELERVLAAVGEGLAPAGGARIFLEANPEDVTAERAARWRALGVSFLSLGVQSFDAGELAFLGRRHDPREARRAVELALDAGFETVSVDLIYGLPGQDRAAWRSVLEQALALGPHHLSCYELEIHERTVFGKRRRRGELALPPDGVRGGLFDFTHRFLAERGYPGYEVSNFARGARHESRHNRKYWRHVPYLGLGPSAHSFDGRRRWWNERHVARWQRRLAEGESPVAGSEVLDDGDVVLEILMLGLRTAAGVDLDGLERRFGYDLVARNRDLMERYRRDGLVELAGVRLVPTLAGLAVADALAASFEIGTEVAEAVTC